MPPVPPPVPPVVGQFIWLHAFKQTVAAQLTIASESAPQLPVLRSTAHATQ